MSYDFDNAVRILGMDGLIDDREDDDHQQSDDWGPEGDEEGYQYEVIIRYDAEDRDVARMMATLLATIARRCWDSSVVEFRDNFS